MKNERIISLLVTPYVHSFLKNEFGTVTLFARQNTVIGHHVISSLIFEYRGKQIKKKDNKHVKIILNRRMIRYYGRLREVARRTLFFDYLFKEKLFSFVDGSIANGSSKYDAVRSFCAKYEITPDMIDESSLYRIYQKHKSIRSKNIEIHQKISPLAS